MECGLVCVVFCHLGKLVVFGVCLFFQRRVREGVKGDSCLFFFQILSGGGFEKLLEIIGKIRCLRRIDHCHSPDRKRKVPKYPFLLRTCLFLTSEQVKIVFLGHLGLTADSKPDK